jgi:paraquat-inducible protein A
MWQMNDKRQTQPELSTMSDKEARILWWLLVLSVILLATGLTAPMLTISQFLVIRSSFSVASGIYELLKNDQVILFMLVSAFSILLPVLKILVLFRLIRQRHSASRNIKKLLHLMHDYGRWSMLDVLVVAILIVAVKLGTIASIQIHYGLTLFGMAVLLIMFITHRVVRLTAG